MRLFLLALVALILSGPPASADDETPYGWEQCTTTFAGDTEGCLDFVANPCTTQERDPCLANYAKAWFAFGVNRYLRQAFAPASPGKRTDLKRLSNSMTTAGSFTEDCAKNDVDWIFRSIITSVLRGHGPKADAQ